MGRRTKAELNSRRMTIDEIWMEFKAWDGELKQQRFAGLILHYAPIAKYIAMRFDAMTDEERNLMLPIALIALARAIEDWTGHSETGFRDFALQRIREACVAQVEKNRLEFSGGNDAA